MKVNVFKFYKTSRNKFSPHPGLGLGQLDENQTPVSKPG